MSTTLLNKNVFTISKMILTNKKLVSDTIIPEKKIEPFFLFKLFGHKTKIIKEHWVLKNYTLSVKKSAEFQYFMIENNKLFDRSKLYIMFTDGSYISEYFDTDEDMLKRVEELKVQYDVETVEFNNK